MATETENKINKRGRASIRAAIVLDLIALALLLTARGQRDHWYMWNAGCATVVLAGIAHGCAIFADLVVRIVHEVRADIRAARAHMTRLEKRLKAIEAAELQGIEQREALVRDIRDRRG